MSQLLEIFVYSFLSIWLFSDFFFTTLLLWACNSLMSNKAIPFNVNIFIDQEMFYQDMDRARTIEFRDWGLQYEACKCAYACYLSLTWNYANGLTLFACWNKCLFVVTFELTIIIQQPVNKILELLNLVQFGYWLFSQGMQFWVHNIDICSCFKIPWLSLICLGKGCEDWSVSFFKLFSLLKLSYLSWDLAFFL